MGIQRCSCCDQYDFYVGQNVRIFVENIEDAFDLGLDGSRIFQVLQVGCDCIVVRDVQPLLPIDQRRITIDCKKIVAIVGAPGTGDNNGL
ncbi:MAG: hypothetical protein GX177_00445 [Firmicutes bacterium]|nr:hypothetical protein [Bacillota bacterium]